MCFHPASPPPWFLAPSSAPFAQYHVFTIMYSAERARAQQQDQYTGSYWTAAGKKWRSLTKVLKAHLWSVQWSRVADESFK